MHLRENNTRAGTVTATDADSEDSVVAYNISGGSDADLLSIDQNYGDLMFAAAPDYEAPADHNRGNTYEIVVTVTSGTGERELTSTQAIMFTVTDDPSETVTRVPDPPSPTVTHTTEASLTVGWQQPAGPPVEDYDLQYRVAGTTAWSDWTHSGSARTATISGLTAGTTYEVRIRATNTEGTGEWSNPFIATTAGNQAPQFTSPPTLTVREQTQQVAEVTAVDSDPEDTVNSYGITGGTDRTLLTIDGAGNLAFTEAPDYEAPLDSDRNNRYEVVVAATSGTGARLKTATQRITINVTDDTAEVPPNPVRFTPGYPQQHDHPHGNKPHKPMGAPEHDHQARHRPPAGAAILLGRADTSPNGGPPLLLVFLAGCGGCAGRPVSTDFTWKADS